MHDITLDEAVAAAKELPKDAQAALAAALMEGVEDISVPDRPTERQALIRERLAKPLVAVSRDELSDILRRYSPAV
jgi:hypothetical protein